MHVYVRVLVIFTCLYVRLGYLGLFFFVRSCFVTLCVRLCVHNFARQQILHNHVYTYLHKQKTKKTRLTGTLLVGVDPVDT
jgi:hypothetical protein